MGKFIIELLFTLLLKPLFWVLFWVLYGLSFWIIYATIFGSVFWAIRGAMSGVTFWIIGGIIGGIIGAIGGVVLSPLPGEQVRKKKKVDLGLAVLPWLCFWAFFWTNFLSFLAGMVELSSTTLLWGIGVTIDSSIPIAIFGATGGAIGGLINRAIDKFFEES